METQDTILEVPSNTISLTIGVKVYQTLPLTFGLFRNIEREKSRLSLGDYHNLVKRVDDAGFYNRIMIDAVASFIVSCPQLLKDLNYERIEDMNLIHSGVMYRVYLNQYLPWFTKWLNFLAANDLILNAEAANGTSTNQV